MRTHRVRILMAAMKILKSFDFWRLAWDNKAPLGLSRRFESMPRIAYLLTTLALLSFSFAGLSTVHAAPPPWAAVHACTPPAARFARCHALVRTDVTAQATPAGYGPADLQSAYRLPSNSTFAPGAGPTIAIVDAYDNPNAEADLAVYRSQYGLPACTTANGCFQKVGVSSSSATAGA